MRGEVGKVLRGVEVRGEKGWPSICFEFQCVPACYSAGQFNHGRLPGGGHSGPGSGTGQPSPR